MLDDIIDTGGRLLIVVAAIALVAMLVVLVDTVISHRPAPRDQSCEAYRDWAVQSIPARCLSYYREGPRG